MNDSLLFSRFFYDNYRSTACQHTIALVCLRFFCQIDHSLSLSLRFLCMSRLFFLLSRSRIYNTIVSGGREYRATVVFTSLVPNKPRKSKRHRNVQLGLSPPRVHICDWLHDLPRSSRSLINCIYAQYLSFSRCSRSPIVVNTLAVCIRIAHARW